MSDTIQISTLKNQYKIKVYHFNNGSGGGVLSVIRNLLRYSQNSLIENHVIYTINKDIISHFVTPALTGALTKQVFYYSPKWNFYYTCKRLAELLPDDKAVIVAHDWLELGMVSNLGLQNPVIHVLHGDYDYYYELANKNSGAIDKFIGVSESISKSLKDKLAARDGDIQYLPFPVPYTKQKIFFHQEALHIIFVGRLSKNKGYHLLPEIDKGLIAKGIKVQWHIVGKPESQREIKFWDQPENVKYYFDLSNESVLELLAKMDCFILPSIAEGMPVSLIEAMKVGLVCLVNNLRGGVQELIDDDVTGYKINNNDPEGYINRLCYLDMNRSNVKRIGTSATEKVTLLFDPIKNCALYEELFLFIGNNPKKKNKKPKKAYGSRLDEPWIPNLITRTVRSK